jgi:hypothetical protein
VSGANKVKADKLVSSANVDKALASNKTVKGASKKVEGDIVISQTP